MNPKIPVIPEPSQGNGLCTNGGVLPTGIPHKVCLQILGHEIRDGKGQPRGWLGASSHHKFARFGSLTSFVRFHVPVVPQIIFQCLPVGDLFSSCGCLPLLTVP